MSTTPSRGHGPGDDLPNGVVQLFLGTRLPVGTLRQHGPDGLEERHVVTDTHRLPVGNGQGEGLREFAYDRQEALLAALLSEDVLLRSRQQTHSFGRRSPGPTE